jgi:hypothetical protein
MSDYYIYSRDDMSAARQRIADLERQRDELAELLKDTSGALRVNGLGVIAQKVEEALAKAEKDDE